MAADERIYVEFSPELKDELGDDASLQDIFDEAGIEADIEWAAMPPTDTGVREKALVETVTVLSIGAVPVAAAFKLLESAITHYLDHKAVRDSHFERWVTEPVLDKQGKPLVDKTGAQLKQRRRLGGFDALPEVPGESIAITVGKQSASVKLGDSQAPLEPTGKQ